MSDTCPHGHSRGYCGNPACIPFNAGLDKQLPEKGNKGAECNRTACTTSPADWYNQYTQRWYCETCAKRINQAETHAICDRR